MKARASAEAIPASQVTHPDQIPPDAWEALELIEGELMLSAWRTPKGLLVLTNLRCIGLRREGEIFPPHPWRAGPVFFFYNLSPPRVLFGRFVELSEQYEEEGRTGRYLVRDPVGAAAAISAAMEPGRAAWQERRSRTEELIAARKRLRAARTAGGLPPVKTVRCSYCGTLVDARSRLCPSCGATLA